MRYDEKQIRRGLKILKDGVPYEIRIVYKSGQTYSGYFNNVENLMQSLNVVPKNECNIYITLNDIVEACMSRSQVNQLVKVKKESTTSDKDIEAYRYLLVDLDPERPTDTSSSNDELLYAKEKCRKVTQFMLQQGFSKPIVACSGNGYHVLYRIALANNNDNKLLIQKCLQVLDLYFSDDKVKVDTSVFNPARICKLYGTVAEKGAHTDDRPHRLSFLFDISEDANKVTDKSYLEKLASLLPASDEPRRYNDYRPREFNLRDWLDKHGIRYKDFGGAGRTKYILECCPFDSSHKGKDAAVFQMSDGRIGFHCFHNSCADKTWKDLRLLFEPDAYERKQQEYEKQIYNQFNRNEPKSEPIKEKEGEPIFYTAIDVLNLPRKEESFVKTGIHGIDKKMRGLKKGYVTVVSGLRGSSKSTLLSEIALNAIHNGNRVGIYSGELTERNFMRWLNLQAAGKSKVEPSQYEGYYNVPRKTQEEIAKWLGDKLYLYNNNYGHHFQKVMEVVKKLIADSKVDMIVLDNLMSFDISSLSKDKYEAQTRFILMLHEMARTSDVAIVFVAHPRKPMGFLRLDDISGTADLANAVDNAFIVHRINNDFKRLSKMMFGWNDTNPIFEATNCIEICKDRDGGVTDYFVPLWYEQETKRLKNYISENVIYEWDNDGWEPIQEDLKFE